MLVLIMAGLMLSFLLGCIATTLVFMFIDFMDFNIELDLAPDDF